MTFNDYPSEFLFILYKRVMWLRARRESLTVFEKLWGYPFVWFSFLMDVLYNIFYATFKYKDLPREFLFTSRLKRYKSDFGGWRNDEAVRICEILNKYDEGHC